jgi:hypothetical protein
MKLMIILVVNAKYIWEPHSLFFSFEFSFAYVEYIYHRSQSFKLHRDLHEGHAIDTSIPSRTKVCRFPKPSPCHETFEGVTFAKFSLETMSLFIILSLHVSKKIRGNNQKLNCSPRHVWGNYPTLQAFAKTWTMDDVWWTMDDFYLQPKVKTLKPAHFRSCTLSSFIVCFVVY